MGHHIFMVMGLWIVWSDLVSLTIQTCILNAMSRATSHKRLRACDHYTSRTLICGKGKAGPSLLHTTLHGPTEFVNARWM